MKTPLERAEERLRALNTLLLPLLQASRDYHSVWRLVENLQKNTPTTILSKRDYTVNTILLDMPLGNPLLIVFYVSTQRSRPLSPSQLKQKIKAMKKAVQRIRGKLFNTADILYAIYTPSGLTSGARRIALENKILYSDSLKTILRLIAKYLASRYNALRKKLQEKKRIWGKVPVLLYALGILSKRLGAQVDLPDRQQVISLALNGGKL